MAREPHVTATTRTHRVGGFWRRLRDEERAELEKVGTLQVFPQGTTLMHLADPGQWAAVLKSGQVRVLGVDGTRPIATRQAGDIVGEQAVLDGSTRSATVRADSPVQALVLSDRQLDRVFRLYPRILRVLCVVLSERLREADRNLTGPVDDTFTRVSRLLLRYARNASPSGQRGVHVYIGAQAALAETLSVSRESVVRALGMLRAKKIITTRRGVVTIHDLGALRDLAQP